MPAAVSIRLAGGGALLPGMAGRIETAAGIGTVVVEDPLRCVVRGAAEILERKDQGRRAGPGLRALGKTGSGLRQLAAGRWRRPVIVRTGSVERLPGDHRWLPAGQ